MPGTMPPIGYGPSNRPDGAARRIVQNLSAATLTLPAEEGARIDALPKGLRPVDGRCCPVLDD